MNIKNKFNPLVFLASLGAGGMSVAFFAFLNYTIKHGKGLINISQTHSLTNGLMASVSSFFEVSMVVFIVLHFILTIVFIVRLIPWAKSGRYTELLNKPLANSSLLAPFISMAMSMNVLIGPIRYFIPSMYSNLQGLMMPGMIAWSLIWISLMLFEMKLLRISFLNNFDVDKISFGWLLHPFALGMVSVTGAGIAAMSQNAQIANLAFFMVLVSGSMGLFLMSVKLVSLFKSHFKAEGLPEKQFLPSLLIIVPNITIYAITLLRIGHFLERHHGAHLGSYFLIVMTLAFALQTWYLAFGISLLRDYIRKDLFKEFHVSQWGLVCPFVAYSVLGSFVYNLFFMNVIFLSLIIAVTIFTIFLFFYLLVKQARCCFSNTEVKDKFVCVSN